MCAITITMCATIIAFWKEAQPIWGPLFSHSFYLQREKSQDLRAHHMWSSTTSFPMDKIILRFLSWKLLCGKYNQHWGKEKSFLIFKWELARNHTNFLTISLILAKNSQYMWGFCCKTFESPQKITDVILWEHHECSMQGKLKKENASYKRWNKM